MAVYGYGPLPADLMIVGDVPSMEDVATGRPFSGGPGHELTNYLVAHKIDRDTAYLTNLVKEKSAKKGKPTITEIEEWAPTLEEELRVCEPLVIAAVGRVAIQWFLKSPKANVEDVHGIPFQLDVDGPIIVPCYDPAGGMKVTSNMMHIMDDFYVVSQALQGKVKPRTSVMPVERERDYRLATSPNDLWDMGFGDAAVIGCDTEWTDKETWCYSLSCEPNTGLVVRVGSGGNPKVVKAMNQILNADDVEVVFHHALADLPKLDADNVRPKAIRDTIIQSYLLGRYPQALKSLAYRLLGERMLSYSDMVGPYSRGKELAYLQQVAVTEWDQPAAYPVRNATNGKLKIRTPAKPDKRAQRILNDMEKKGDEVDLRHRWGLVAPEDGRSMVESAIGSMPLAWIDDVPEELAIPYAARDADVTLRVFNVLSEQIETEGLAEIEQVDTATLRMISDMQTRGIKVDREHFKSLDRQFNGKLFSFTQQLDQCTGYHVNPGSGPQVVKAMVNEGKVPMDGVISVTSDKLELWGQHSEIAKSVSECRKFGKLLSTYVNLPDVADMDDRIHTSFNITRTETGRLSSSRPNLQNIPQKTDEGQEIRSGFVPSEGCTFLSIDYSQIELRVGAHISGDENMLSAYRNGEDLHTYTASRVFGIPAEDVHPKKHRYPCKTMNFQIFYGATAYGLKKSMDEEGLDWSEDDCESFRKEWFKLYPGVARWIETIRGFARRKGFVVDMFGRRRWIPEVFSVHDRIVNAGLRQATNMPIQSSAQGVLKIAMDKVTPFYLNQLSHGVTLWPLIQIHDELLFEVGKVNLDSIVNPLKFIMENAVQLDVPIECDVEVAMTWRDLKAYSPPT